MTGKRHFDQRLLGMLVGGIAIRHLAALVAIARDGSPIVAAEHLGCPRAALSRQMAELEAAVGARLVVDAPGGMRLTEGGRRMLPHAEAVLARIDAARAELASLT